MGVMSGFKSIALGIFLFYLLGYLYFFDFSYVFFDVAGVIVPTLLIGYGLFSIVRSAQKSNVAMSAKSEVGKKPEERIRRQQQGEELVKERDSEESLQSL